MKSWRRSPSFLVRSRYLACSTTGSGASALDHMVREKWETVPGREEIGGFENLGPGKERFIQIH